MSTWPEAISISPPAVDKRQLRKDRANILGCEIDRLDMTDMLARCRAAIEQRRYTQHVSINAAKLIALRKQPDLREIIARCHLVGADGQSVVWASKLLGDPLPERVAGIDLMYALISMAEREGYGVYILGARRVVLEAAVERLRSSHPRLRLVGFRDGYFSDDEGGAVADAVRRSKAQLLFVAMSSPRKERWLSQFGDTLEVPFVMGVGGSIDVLAGEIRRAPFAWQRVGLEWLYRLLQEPKRMFPRYLRTNPKFVLLVASNTGLRAIAAGRRRLRSVV